MRKPIQIAANPMDLWLMRAFAQIASEANAAGVDGLEIVACMGAAAGACISSNPNLEDRGIARASVIASMDMAIDDFGKMRAADMPAADAVEKWKE